MGEPEDIDTSDPGFISLEVLAGLYVLLALCACVTLSGRWHSRTPTLQVFAYLLIINCVARTVYFAVPDEMWHTDLVPQDLQPFTPPWWGNFGQSAFYLIANWATTASYMTILHMWQQARDIVRGYSHAGPNRAIMFSVAAFGIWSVILLFSYLALPVHVVLVMQTIMNVIVNIGVAICFIVYWWYLSRAMQDVVMQATASSSVVMSPHPDGSGMLLHVNDGEEETVSRSKQKLTRISAVCAVYTVCAFLKVGLLVVELVDAVHHSMDFDKQTWWVLIFTYYAASEILTSVLVLIIMRKAPQQHQHSIQRHGRSGSVSHSSLRIKSPRRTSLRTAGASAAYQPLYAPTLE